MSHASLTRSRSHSDARKTLLSLCVMAMIGTSAGAQQSHPPRSLVRRALHTAGLDHAGPSASRRRAAPLVPSLSLTVGTGAVELPVWPASWLEAWLQLSWPLDHVRDDAATLAAGARLNAERERVTVRVTDLWRKRQAARARAGEDIGSTLAADQADAELDAVTGEEP